MVNTLVLSYKTPELAKKCMDRVLETTHGIPGTVEHWDNSEENQNIHALWNKFWRGHTGDYICYLTADTLPERNWLRDMLCVFESGPAGFKTFGAVGPSTNRCYNEQSNRVPDIVCWAYIDNGPPCYVPGVLLAGFCMLIRREVLEKLGGFREDFDFYGGDLDFMWRLRMAGWETAWCVPAFVWHEWGVSARERGSEWYAEKRKKGNDQLQQAIQTYNEKPGLWYWDQEARQIERRGTGKSQGSERQENEYYMVR